MVPMSRTKGRQPGIQIIDYVLYQISYSSFVETVHDRESSFGPKLTLLMHFYCQMLSITNKQN